LKTLASTISKLGKYQWHGNAPQLSFLSVNDPIVTNGTANAHGGLEFDSLPTGTPDILDIESLAIENANSNSVLSTTLPRLVSYGQSKAGSTGPGLFEYQFWTSLRSSAHHQ
jgi:hypothetical protein